MPVRFTSEKDFNSPKSKKSSFGQDVAETMGSLYEPTKGFLREGIKGLAGLATLDNPFMHEPLQGGLEQTFPEVGLGNEEKTPSLGTKFGERFGRILGWGGFFNPASAAGSAVAGQTAEQAGFGPVGQTVAEVGASLRLPGKGASANQTGKIAQPRIKTKGASPSEAGLITKGRLTQQLNRVNEEAAELGKSIGQGNQKFKQITSAIERNEPIKQRFDQFFSTLENYTHAQNQPFRNMKPLNDFLANESRLYQGTGSPTKLSKFVMDEIQGWQTSGSDKWYNLFRRYRLNNQRKQELLSDITIDPKLKREQVSYLSRMNDSLKDTFKANLPPNHPWLGAFEQSNDAYSSYLNTVQARKILQPLVTKNMTDAQLNKFLSNDKGWQDLERFLGPQESGNLKDILKDLQSARNSLQSMQRFPSGSKALAELAKSAFLKEAGLGKLAVLLQLPKAWKWAVGQYYSSPSFQGNLHELAEALSEQNSTAAGIALSKMGEAPEKKEEKKVRFTPSGNKDK